VATIGGGVDKDIGGLSGYGAIQGSFEALVAYVTLFKRQIITE